jgi:hypothetical protein
VPRWPDLYFDGPIRGEKKQLMMEEGCEFFKDGGRKHRYVGIYGDRRISGFCDAH